MLEEQTHSSRRQGQQIYAPEQDFEISLVDIVRFFYANGSKLITYFSLLMLVGLSGVFVWRSTRPLKVQGRLVLSFKGIEKGEYPDGRKFSIENLRSPDIIGQALVDAKIATDQAAASKLSVDVEIKPIVPKAVAMRWAKQDKEGAPRDDYFPNEFAVTLALGDLPRDRGLLLFDSIVKRYQEREKAAQLSSLRITGNGSQSNFYGNLLQDPNYDYGDILRILDSSVGPLNASISQILGNDLDPALQIGLKDIQNDLSVWSVTHLETLKAMTYGGGIVKNKEVSAARVRYRLSDYSIQIRQKTEEISEAFKLLAAVQKPQPMLVGQLGKETLSPADSSALDRLINNNYVAPLVRRISDLQHETKALEAEKMRLERDAALIAQARSVAPGHLPSSYRDGVTVASKELEKIIDRYNSVIYQYLTMAIVGAITIKDGPAIARGGPATIYVLALIVLISGLFAIIWVHLETLLRTARDEDRA